MPRSAGWCSTASARSATPPWWMARQWSWRRRVRRIRHARMRIFRHYRDVPDAFKGAVAAVGNFDGVHRGHQALIGEAKRMADERGAPLGVLAFEPHPQEFFRPSPESFRLTPFRAKARLIAEAGADILYALAFDAEMAAKPAE